MRGQPAAERAERIRLESLVFEGEPVEGVYQVYASLNAACGEPHVSFDLNLYQSRADGEGWTVDETALASGQLLGFQADRGASLGAFLTSVQLP